MLRRPSRHAKLVADRAIRKKATQQPPKEDQPHEEEDVRFIGAALASALT